MELACEPVHTGRDELPLIRDGMRLLQQVGNPLRQLRLTFERLFAPIIEPFFRTLVRAAQTADLLVSHAATLVATVVHKETGIPHVPVMLTHMVPSAYYPPTPVPPFHVFWRRFPRPVAHTLNRWNWALTVAASNRTVIADMNRVLRKQGLPCVNDIYEPLRTAPLCVVAVSQGLVTPQPDRPSHCRVTGFLFNHPNLKWTPDPGLIEFMEGVPPVVFNFGSMAGEDLDRWTRLLVQATEISGYPKALIQSGWANLGSGDLPQHIRAIGFAPHDWLFERAACVVHHCGAGTSAAVLQAGVPTVVVTCLNDQFIWGSELRHIGVCKAVLRLRRLRASHLGRAIARTVASGTLRERARSVGARVRNEHGVMAARCEIESVLSRK